MSLHKTILLPLYAASTEDSSTCCRFSFRRSMVTVLFVNPYGAELPSGHNSCATHVQLELKT